jgi:RNA polymerase sigma factor (sigma-70 family)
VLNVAISRSRRQPEVPHQDLGDDDLGAWPEPEGDDPALLVVETAMDPVLRRALDSLSPGYRVVLVLVDVEGMRYREVADLLGIPLGTVMSRVHRARIHLRQALAGTHLDPRRRT